MSENILNKIVETKKRELIERKKSISVETFQNGLAKSERSFFDALNNNQSDFIFECKKASPSKGLIRKDFNLGEILEVYKDYASAISVLTDFPFFQGSFSYLTQASQTVKQPILCKDFFIDPYQVYEARHYGADAILLMLSVLDNEKYKELSKVAKQLNLDVLTEVHDTEEMQRAIQLGAKIIGVNNRNLKDLSIDIKTTEILINQLPEKIKNNPNILFISESGINNHQQVKQLAPKVNGFLIGSSIMSKDNIRQQCKELLFGQIKICGLKQKADAITADQSGAIYGGLIFYPKSPRYINLDQAQEIVNTADLIYVGVFVNEKIENIVNTVNQLQLTVIQLHGDESKETIAELKERLPQCDIWKAISVKKEMLQAIDFNNSNVSHYLLDTYHVEQRGGSGETFDWSLLDSIENIEHNKIIIAGGLNNDNIIQASKLNTFLLDVNSGVEDSPANKSINKIKQLFSTLRV